MQDILANRTDGDDTEKLAELVRDASSASRPLRMRGSGSKFFFGRQISGGALDLSGHGGIVAYEPSELVLTARSGTPLQEIERALAASGQMLAFEPPHYGDGATLGGTIACGLSGPRRPFAGSARDFVLGVKIMNGDGDVLAFGGQVMKNVAGYDISRLMTGALGTLGVLLEISIKVLPLPEVQRTCVLELDQRSAIDDFTAMSASPLPISAAAHYDGLLRVRLSGTERGVSQAAAAIGGDALPDGDEMWRCLREQTLPFFGREEPLWRISLPANTAGWDVEGDWLVDWGGALRWGYSPLEFEDMQAAAGHLGGHACLYRSDDPEAERFAPLPETISAIHARLKSAFDPKGIFNPGIMYPHL